MNSGIDPLQLAAQGAQVLVAEMVKSGWMSLREALKGIFHKSGNGTRQLEMLDADQQDLSQASAAERDALRTRILNRWQIQLSAILEQYPEIQEDLLELIEYSRSGPTAGNSGNVIIAARNKDSQIVQSAGDIQTGNGNISFKPPAR